MYYVNLTQHAATPEQKAAGVVDLLPDVKAHVIDALTFEAPPTAHEMADRADFISELCLHRGFDAIEVDGEDLIPFAAMIGGAPYFMPYLERALAAKFVRPFYAFTQREVVETQAHDGSVKKTAVFRHAGWVEGSC